MREDGPSQSAPQGRGPEPAGAEALVEAILEVLAAERVRRVLDLGCGRGDLSAKLVRRGYAVTGVDLDQAAIDLARRRVPGPTFYSAPATRIPCKAASFGAVILPNAAGVLHQAEAQLEIGRVLRRHGVLIAVTPVLEGSSFPALSAEAATSQPMPDGMQEQWICLRSERFDVLHIFAGIGALDAHLRQSHHITGNTLAADRYEILAALQPELASPGPIALRQPCALRVLRKI